MESLEEFITVNWARISNNAGSLTVQNLWLRLKLTTDKYTNGQKKGYTVYMSNYSIPKLNTQFFLHISNVRRIKT